MEVGEPDGGGSTGDAVDGLSVGLLEGEVVADAGVSVGFGIRVPGA